MSQKNNFLLSKPNNSMYWKNNYLNFNKYSEIYFKLNLLKNFINFFFLKPISYTLLQKNKYFSKYIYISQIWINSWDIFLIFSINMYTISYKIKLQNTTDSFIRYKYLYHYLFFKYSNIF